MVVNDLLQWQFHMKVCIKSFGLNISGDVSRSTMKINKYLLANIPWEYFEGGSLE